MLRYLRAETRRYFRNRYTWIAGGIVLAISLLISYFWARNLNTVHSGHGTRVVIGSGIPSWSMAGMLFVAYGQLGLIFLLITNILIVLYYREWQNRTIALTMATGLSRTKLYWIKYLHAALMTAFILLFFFVVHTGFLIALTDSAKMAALIPQIANFYGFLLIYYLAYLAILHGLVFLSGGGFLPMILGLVLATEILESLFINLLRLVRSVGPWKGSEIADFLQRYSLGTAHRTVVMRQAGLGNFGFLFGGTQEPPGLAHGLLVLLGYSIVFLGAGYFSFLRRSVTE